MHRLTSWLMLFLLVLCVWSTAGAQISGSEANTVCNFNQDQQLAVDYRRIQFPPKEKVLGDKIPYGKVWAPGDKPLTLFANTSVTVGGKDISDGAYTMFILPEEKSWTLIISRSTDTSGKYDETQDIAKIRMDFGELPKAEPEFTAYFAHTAPNQCNLRLDVGEARAWIVFKQQQKSGAA